MLALYIVAGIVLFILLVFSIPLDMAFDVGGPGAARSRMRVGWVFGLLGKEFGRGRKVPPSDISHTDPSPEERAPKRQKKKKQRITTRFRSLLMTKGVARGLLKLFRRILRGVRVKHLDARLEIGLDAPADTGMLYSTLWPVFVPLTVNGSAKVRMELSFEQPALNLTARGCIRVIPIQMVWSVLLFALSPAGLRMMRRMVMRR